MENLETAEKIAPGEPTDIPQCRFQSVRATAKQEQIKGTVDHAGDVTETTQADLTKVLLDFQATARHQLEQLVADFSRGAVIDALHHADEFLGR
ncbi:hypothetical protein D3C76_1215090 [compost metagenome]